MTDINDYYAEGEIIDFQERETTFDFQRDFTNFFDSRYESAKKRISPTSMGNCERRMVINTIKQPRDWNAWGEVYAKTGNCLEDLIAGFYSKNVGVGKLISQDNEIAFKDLNVFSYSDLFLNVNGEFVIGEVKSVGGTSDMPFEVNPKKIEGKDWNELQQERIDILLDKKYENITQLMFYTSLLGADGVMIYVSRNSQKGNGQKNSPKYFNGGSAFMKFNPEDAREIIARIHFTNVCIKKRIIPPVPEHMKPEGTRKTSDKCGFCSYTSQCFKNQDFYFDLNGYTHMKEETVQPLWERCFEWADRDMSVAGYEKRRALVYQAIKKNKKNRTPFKVSYEDFLEMFSFKGYV